MPGQAPHALPRIQNKDRKGVRNRTEKDRKGVRGDRKGTEKVSGTESQLVTYSDVTLLPQCGPKNHGIGS
jgi:hypothetical protein